MNNAHVAISIGPRTVRLLMKREQTGICLKATLPISKYSNSALTSLVTLLDGLAEFLPEPLSVVLSVPGWGGSPEPHWSGNCADEVSAELLEYAEDHHEFERLRELLDGHAS